MAYTDIDDPTIYFNTKLYTGTGSSNAITGVGFQPDWVWIKSRSDGLSHALFDSVRGVTKVLNSNATTAEYTNTDTLTAFGTDGFTVGSNTGVNTNTATRVAWNWKADSAVSGNTLQGGSSSKTYAGRVNTTAGISIIKYVGNGVGGHEIPHNLSETPVFYIIKRLSDTEHWQVYHASNTSAPQTDYLQLSTNEATVDANTRWNDTAPGTNSIVVGSHVSVNTENDNYIAYIFSQKKGYSKFGSYTGNGNADGSFVYTGFKPALVIVKKSDSEAQNWFLMDNKRNGFNGQNYNLEADTNEAEQTNSDIDILSNGFKCRSNGNGHNTSGHGYIFMAFAEQPFVTSTGVPATAR